MKKVLLTASVQHHFNAFHFPLIDIFHEKGFEVEIAAHDVMGGEQHESLKKKTDKIYDIPFERSPFSLKNKEAYKQLKKVIDENGNPNGKIIPTPILDLTPSMVESVEDCWKALGIDLQDLAEKIAKPIQESFLTPIDDDEESPF